MKKKVEWKFNALPKLAPFYNKRLKSTDVKVLSASALISDNTVCMGLQWVVPYRDLIGRPLRGYRPMSNMFLILEPGKANTVL